MYRYELNSSLRYWLDHYAIVRHSTQMIRMPISPLLFRQKSLYLSIENDMTR